MRLIHVIDSLNAGGKERQCIELLKGLSAYSDLMNQLIVLAPGTFYEGVRALPNVRVAHLARRFRKDISILAPLWRLFRDFRPEIVAAYDSMSAVLVAPIVRLLGARFINAMIQNAPRRLSWEVWTRRLLSFPVSDAIVANSEAGLAAYGAPSNRARVIRNGYDFGRLGQLRDPATVRCELGLSGQHVVGMVANFSPTKDQPTFITAAEAVLAKRRDVVFFMIGDGIARSACERQRAPAHSEQIRFLGARTDIESLVNVFDIGVLATFTEGISNAIMEYMALGKPVLATRGGGTAEIVMDGETGWLVDERDPSALAEGIERLLSDEALRRGMGRAGHARLVAEFTLERLASAHRNLYDELMAGKGAPHDAGGRHG
jgi:glycosyltransferase involved in cell wall biosynthesis